jgi:hypothetical protein
MGCRGEEDNNEVWDTTDAAKRRNLLLSRWPQLSATVKLVESSSSGGNPSVPLDLPLPPSQRNQSTQARQNRRSTVRKNLKTLLLVLVVVTTGYGAYRFSQPSRPEIMGFLWPNPKILTAFELDTTQESSLNLERVHG